MSWKDENNAYIAFAAAAARSGRPLVFYDTETTGLNQPWAERPRIYEIAGVKRTADGTRTAKSAMVRIGMPIPDAANLRRLDPLLPDRVGRDPRLVFTTFASWIEGTILVGQNILDFDNRIMAMAYHDLGMPIPVQLIDERHCIDTVRLARAMYPDKGRPGNPVDHKLVTLGVFLGIAFNPGDLHGAAADVSLTEQVLDALVRRIPSDRAA